MEVEKTSWLQEIVMFSFCRYNSQGHVGIKNKKLTPSYPLPSPTPPATLSITDSCLGLQQVDFTLVCAIRLSRQQALYCFGVCSEVGKVWLGNVAKLLKGNDFLVHI